MLENIAFFQTKGKSHQIISTLKVGEGDSLRRVPTPLSGMVDFFKLASIGFYINGVYCEIRPSRFLTRFFICF